MFIYCCFRLISSVLQPIIPFFYSIQLDHTTEGFLRNQRSATVLFINHTQTDGYLPLDHTFLSIVQFPTRLIEMSRFLGFKVEDLWLDLKLDGFSSSMIHCFRAPIRTQTIA